MMATEFRLPDLGEGIESGEVVSVLVSVGDSINVEQSLLELETNKATVDVPSTVSGVVSAIHVKEGQSIGVGELVLTIEESSAGTATTNEKPVAQKTAAASAKTEQVLQFVLPDLGEGIDSGDVVSVLVKPGDIVAKDQSLLELETNKATVDVPSPEGGVIEAVHIKEGQNISIGTLIATIKTAATGGAVQESSSMVAKSAGSAAVAAPSATAVHAANQADLAGVKAERGEAIPASPAMRRKAREWGIDLYNVPGTGPGGRITEEDIDRYLKAAISGNVQQVVRSSEPSLPPLPDFSKWGAIETEAYKSLRKKTAEHVTLSWQQLPHVTQFDQVDVTDLEAKRKSLAEAIKSKGGRLTPNVLLMKAVVHALQQFPQFNASLDTRKNEIIYKKYYHIGIAANTPKGLMVPVIRDVDQKSIEELAIELAELGARAMDGKIKPEELQGGTFTISNLGHIGGTGFTPIINYPEVAILGVSRQVPTPVVRDGNIVSRLMLPFCVSYDHRVIDGVAGAEFTRAIVQFLEELKPFA